MFDVPDCKGLFNLGNCGIDKLGKSLGLSMTKNIENAIRLDEHRQSQRQVFSDMFKVPKPIMPAIDPEILRDHKADALFEIRNSMKRQEQVQAQINRANQQYIQLMEDQRDRAIVAEQALEAKYEEARQHTIDAFALGRKQLYWGIAVGVIGAVLTGVGILIAVI